MSPIGDGVLGDGILGDGGGIVNLSVSLYDSIALQDVNFFNAALFVSPEVVV